jgi:Family of unknown function (DUF6065)
MDPVHAADGLGEPLVTPAEDGRGGTMELVAYPITSWVSMQLSPAPVARAWMNATHQHFAQRCLPLLMANQAGWLIHNSHAFRVAWDGGTSPSSLTIMYLRRNAPYPAASMFGYGIVTFLIPYLFRTPPGYNLLARGPANMPKDGIAPLEGLIETDWSVATFTMNWQLTRPDHVVTFEEDEPICMIVPQRRGELEAFRPRMGSMDAEPELATAHDVWARSRHDFLGRLRMTPRGESQFMWQKHYFHGTSPSGVTAEEHQRKLKLQPFEQDEAEAG